MINDEKIISALLKSSTIVEASRTCGVSISTIQKRLRNDDFKKKYDAARLEALRQTTAYLQGLTGEATSKMRSVMNAEDASLQTQLNAADAILRNTYKLTDATDILQRLEALEQAAKEIQKERD